MSMQAPRASQQTTSEATIRFRRDQLSSGVSRIGHLRAGGQLRVEYDPSRLINADNGKWDPVEVVCHARFRPEGQEHSASLKFPARISTLVQGMPRPGLFQTSIPEQSTLVELWFERRGTTGPEGWDSRFGRNYRFPVVDHGLPVPEQSVELRSGAIVNPNRIRVVQDAAAKTQTRTGATGFALRTDLRVSLRISQDDELTTAWADIHVFDATCELIHSDTIALCRADALTARNITHAWSASVYQGSGGGSGAGVWSRPDSHSVQYRLYCLVGEELFTDGVLHQFDVSPDAEIRPIPGSW